MRATIGDDQAVVPKSAVRTTVKPVVRDFFTNSIALRSGT